MGKLSLITVGIPTYNRREYLKQAIESVLAQTFGDFTILVSDNASTDGTQELVMEYAKADRRIVYHCFPTNRGPAYNWHYLLEHAESPLFAWLPDDDLWLPDHLINGVQAFQATPDASLFGCIAETFGKNTSNLYQPFWLEGCTVRTVFDARKRFVPCLRNPPMPPASVIYRRLALARTTFIHDNSFGAGDWFVWGQVALCGAIVFDPVVRVKYRWHEGNDSNQYKGRRAAAQIRFTLRQLATWALRQQALNTKAIVEEVCAWPVLYASNLVVALAVCDAHPALRRAAWEILRQRPELRYSHESSQHFRLVRRVGGWYLAFADIADRIIGRWWRLVK